MRTITQARQESNGVIERTRGWSGQNTKGRAGHRIWTRIPPNERILCWLVEFAAYLMNRCGIGSDGNTPLQKLHVHGRKDNLPILELGEKILYMPAKEERN